MSEMIRAEQRGKFVDRDSTSLNKLRWDWFHTGPDLTGSGSVSSSTAARRNLMTGDNRSYRSFLIMPAVPLPVQWWTK